MAKVCATMEAIRAGGLHDMALRLPSARSSAGKSVHHEETEDTEILEEETKDQTPRLKQANIAA